MQDISLKKHERYIIEKYPFNSNKLMVTNIKLDWTTASISETQLSKFVWRQGYLRPFNIILMVTLALTQSMCVGPIHCVNMNITTSNKS